MDGRKRSVLVGLISCIVLFTYLLVVQTLALVEGKSTPYEYTKMDVWVMILQSFGCVFWFAIGFLPRPLAWPFLLLLAVFATIPSGVYAVWYVLWGFAKGIGWLIKNFLTPV